MSDHRKEFSLEFVVPCFNEEEVLPTSIATLHDILRRLSTSAAFRITKGRIILVDDGSKDDTWRIIDGERKRDPNILGIKLSRNCGHQLALLAGLEASQADVVVSIDADLQDDVEVIEDMLAAYVGGCDIALGVRSDRRTDDAFKRVSANCYYKALEYLGLSVIPNHADFRLLSRLALAALLQHREVNLYIRGLIPSLGFSVALIPYARKARTAGETKYTMTKMMRLAIDGVTSFSTTPLRLVAIFGVALFFATIVIGAYVLTIRLLFPAEAVPGWASTLLPLISLGGIQILAIGVLGEYVGKIYMEVKQRPRYFIEKLTEITK